MSDMESREKAGDVVADAEALTKLFAAYVRGESGPWIHEGDDVIVRPVAFEHKGDEPSIYGELSITFKGTTNYVVEARLEVEGKEPSVLSGKRLEKMLLDLDAEWLVEPTNVSAVVSIYRPYSEDVAALSVDGYVTPKALAIHLLKPFQAAFGKIAGLSFRRLDDDRYSVDARLPLKNFPKVSADVESWDDEIVIEAKDAMNAFEHRLMTIDSGLKGTSIEDEEYTIHVDGNVIEAGEVTTRHDDMRARNGDNVRDYSARELAAATQVQIGDHAIVLDGEREDFVVVHLHEDGGFRPVAGNLCMSEAEVLLETLTKDVEPIWASTY